MNRLILFLIGIVASCALLFGCEDTQDYVYDPDHYDRDALCKYLTTQLSGRGYEFPDQIKDPTQKNYVKMYNANGCDK